MSWKCGVSAGRPARAGGRLESPQEELKLEEPVLPEGGPGIDRGPVRCIPSAFTQNAPFFSTVADFMKHSPLASDAACRVVSPTPLTGMLGVRSLRAVELKQRLLHACRDWPPVFQKPLLKILWPPPLRHMRYVPPGVRLLPGAGGEWRMWLRGHGDSGFTSIPVSELRALARKPAVVIATGPTANEFDWSTLADGSRIIWAVNGAPTLLEKHGLKCDFLVVTDHRFARDGADQIELAAKQGAVLCFSYEAAAGFAALRPEVLARTPFHLFEKANAWYGIPLMSGPELADMNEGSGSPFLLPTQAKPGVGWSHDPGLGVFAGRTVAFAALQLVVWSGSCEIEVVGLDLGGKARAYEEKNPVVSHLEKDLENYIRPAFDCMAAALSGKSIRILNHSRTSPLPRDLVPQP